MKIQVLQRQPVNFVKIAPGISALALIACTNLCFAYQGAAQNSAESMKQPAENIAVGVLQSREYMVELQSTDRGALYTVKNLSGSVLAEDISADEVVAQFPRLHHLVEGLADDASLQGSELGGEGREVMERLLLK